jgi:hypothetical protein
LEVDISSAISMVGVKEKKPSIAQYKKLGGLSYLEVIQACKLEKILFREFFYGPI